MAEQAVNSVILAMTGELTSRVFSGMIQMYSKEEATDKKLQRLEMLLIKIHSVVEASEKHIIKNSRLLRWRDKLKEAASQGDKVLDRFLQPAKDVQTIINVEANQQQKGEAASSSAAASATAVCAPSFMRNPLSSIAQGIHSASKILFVRGDDDLERLNKILARLEKLSPDIGEFIRLLHLEALPKVVRLHGSRKKKRRLRSNPSMRRTTSRHSLFSFSPLNEEKMEGLMARDFCLSRTKEEKAERVAREFCLPRIDELEELPLITDLECNSPVLWKEQQRKLLQDRLLAAFAAIREAVELAGSRDLEDLQWLVYWTGILREAKQQGCAVLGAISAHKTINTKDNRSIVDCDQEKDELSGFVHRLEGLASDVVHFNKLVYLCRAC